MPYNLKHTRTTRTTRRAPVRRRTNTTSTRVRRMYKKKGVITTFNPQPHFGPGARLRTKLNFTINASIGSVAGAMTPIQYRLNSLYDPEVALGGGQPMYFDQLAAIYSRYRVWNCKVSLCVHGTLAADAFVVAAPNNNGMALASIDFTRLQQAPGAFPIMVTNSYGKAIWATRTYSIPKHMGMSVLNYAGSDDTQAQIGADPNDAIYFAVGCVNPASVTTGINYVLKLEYDVEFFDQNLPSIS